MKLDFDSSLESLIQKWIECSAEAEPMILRMPLGVYLEEANQLAALMDQHLDPLVERGRSYPGLSRAFDDELLTWETAAEMRELSAVAFGLQARAASQIAGTLSPSLDELRQARSEWMSGLKYLFQKSNDPEGLRRLKELRAAYKDQSRIGTAESLKQVTEVAARHLEQLKPLGYQEDQLHQAQALPDQLKSELARLENEKQRQAHALQTRNRVIAVLDERVNAARRAFRFVFRRHRDVLDRAQSKYAQKRRQAHAARQKQLGE